MANNITPKLKAYVQTDATGRVVSGTPVFRTSKPKSGNWKEIPMYYRGSGLTTTTTTTNNPSTTTTSTSHSGGGGGNTVTAFVKTYWTNPLASCDGGFTQSLLFYSSSPTLTTGVSIFLDATLTTPVNNDYVIRTDSIFPGMYKDYIVQNGVLTDFSCIGDKWFSTIQSVACSQSSPAQLMSASINNNGNLSSGTKVFANFGNAGYSIGQMVYMTYSLGAAAMIISTPTEATITVTGPC